MSQQIKLQQIADITATATELNILDGVTGTLVTEAGTQTLTNKTITSPTISNPTLTGTYTFTSDATSTPAMTLTANSINDGVGALRINGSQADIYLNPSTATHTTVTFAVNDDQRLAFGMDDNSDFYITRRTSSTWYDDTFVLDRDTGLLSLGYGATVAGTLTYSTLNDGTTALTSTVAELNYVDGVTSNIQTQLDAKLALAGGTMSGAIAMGTNKITGMGDPTAAQDAATKAYVDTQVAGGGSGHTIQNAGSSLTARTNLNFDGTYLVATDDAGNDQTDVTIGSGVVTTTGTQTLTNKTLTAPVISSITNTGTLTLPTSTGTIALTSDIPTNNNQLTNGAGYTTNTGDITGVTAGVGLSGGGSSGAVSLAVDLSELTDMTAAMVGTDEFIVLDAGADRRKAASEIGLSIFNNDSGFTTTSGTVTSVAGTGTVNGLTLSGTVTSSGSLTLGGTFSATVSEISDLTATAAELNVLDGIPGTLTATELGYVDGVTSAIQTQLDAKAPLAAPAFTGTATGVNLTLSGDLTVNGTTTTVNTTNLVVSDNLIELNNGAASNANDSGIVIERGSTGDNAFIGWDESADKFVVGTTTATGASTGDLTITTGTLVANIEGNVTGAITGNADTATALATARNIAGQPFDGSAAITIASTDLSDTSSITLNAATQTLTNKTLTSPNMTSPSIDGVAVTATAAELNYVDGVTSNIQTQLNAKGTGTVSSLSDLSITATATELNYVDGVTSNIQTQLDGKQASGSYLTGNQTITLSGDASGSGTTSIVVTVADDSHNHIISNVDGLQTALDAKLDSSSYTAADVLTKIKTVDGAGSGLDADLLDGVSSASFLRSDAGDTASGSYSFTNSYNEFGNATGSVSNDGGWAGRVNVAGAAHARLDVNCVNDGIITTMYSHTGQGTGRVGTMSNHPLTLMANGVAGPTVNTSGYFTSSRYYSGGASGYFYNDASTRTAFAGGDLYIQNSVGNYYNYATNQYHGGTSGDNHYFRGNTLSGNSWSLNSAGTFTGVSNSAKYADLAERYTSDNNYEAGTVLVFGGDEEVTESTQRLDKRIAGIVSTDPAYLMNSALENSVAVGLQGRVPCKVVGEIRKGDLMVASDTAGHAEAWRDESNPPAGSVIGKALENKTGASTDVIEVVVGRL